MPPEYFIEPTSLDFDNMVADHDQIYTVLPHRYEFERLDGIVLLDEPSGLIAGFKDLQDEEFWVRGHIPDRPLFPGVMMIETAAQLVSYYTQMVSNRTDQFLGFAAVDGVKFRGTVQPGQRLVMVGKLLENRPRRCIGATQGFVDGKMVYEGQITGMWL